MSICMLGHKIGMTQIFNEKGSAIPVTVLKVGPCTVTKIKSLQDKQHQNIQIGYHLINPQKLNKPQIGYFNKISLPCFKYLREYKTYLSQTIQVGDILTVKQFKIGHLVNISGMSIGKGFTGYQKRHHFSRGPMSHGSKNHRQPGSIGAGTTPGRVFPGKKMAGRMGHNNITIRNLQIIDINTEDNLLIIKGAIPGKPGNLINIYKK